MAEEPTRTQVLQGPRKESLSKYVALEDKGDIVVTTVMPHQIAGLSDEQIRQRYPRREKPLKKKRTRTDCAILQFRDERWAWAAPICKYVDEHREDVFETEELRRLVKARAEELGRETVHLRCGSSRARPRVGQELNAASLLPQRWKRQVTTTQKGKSAGPREQRVPQGRSAIARYSPE